MNFNKFKNLKLKKDVNFSSKKFLIEIKKLTFGIKKSLGKDKNGQLLFHRGGGVKKKYRLINYNILEKSYRIIQNQYDPYRSCFLSLIQYKDGSLSYILANSTNEANKNINNEINSNSIVKGGQYLLNNLSTKTLIYNVEITKQSKNRVSKSAGSYSKIFSKNEKFATIILPSKTKINVSLKCKAFVGICSNSFKRFKKLYKAGTNRFLNKRPIVRGVAMNPIDHPHGGGEGKSTSGRPCVSP